MERARPYRQHLLLDRKCREATAPAGSGQPAAEMPVRKDGQPSVRQTPNTRVKAKLVGNRANPSTATRPPPSPARCEGGGFRVNAAIICGRDLEHLLRYCARPPFALERLSVIRGEDGRIARVRYVLPRHKAANWVGPGRGRKSTRPDASGVVELSPFEFLDRLADLVPLPRKHRHRYHGVFAPNHKLRSAVTAHDKRECRQAA